MLCKVIVGYLLRYRFQQRIFYDRKSPGLCATQQDVFIIRIYRPGIGMIELQRLGIYRIGLAQLHQAFLFIHSIISLHGTRGILPLLQFYDFQLIA
ncbi:hypothetical protein D3C78_1249710 [compost metagenome]